MCDTQKSNRNNFFMFATTNYDEKVICLVEMKKLTNSEESF